MSAAVDNFGEFVRSLPKEGKSRGSGSRKWIDEAPNDAAELAAYFLSLKPGHLASCWVACVVDAAVFGVEPGPLARALVVVAERLHGVKFESQPVGDQPMSRIPSSSPFKAAKAPDAAPPPATPKQVGKFEIHTGPPPEAKPKHQRAAYTEAIAAAMALPPGGWFAWADAKKTMNVVKATEKFKAACGFDVIVYRTVPGTVVVKRPAPQGA